MPLEKSFQTTSQLKLMYKKGLKPVEMLYNQSFKACKHIDPLPMTKEVLRLKSNGGSI